jgi:hypothetical protein
VTGGHRAWAQHMQADGALSPPGAWGSGAGRHVPRALRPQVRATSPSGREQHVRVQRLPGRSAR